MNKNGKLLRLLQKCLLEFNPAILGATLRLVNMISIIFNIIPKPEYAKFYIFERKKVAKG